MAIGHAEQRGPNVYVFDDKGKQIKWLPGELVGFTSTTVSIKRGVNTYLFNDKCAQIKIIFGKS